MQIFLQCASESSAFEQNKRKKCARVKNVDSKCDFLLQICDKVPGCPKGRPTRNDAVGSALSKEHKSILFGVTTGK